MTGENDAAIDRRTFLKRSGVGAFGFAGLAPLDLQDGSDGQGGNGQNGGDGKGGGNGRNGGTGRGGRDGQNGEDEQAAFARRFVFRYPERLDGQEEPAERYDPTGDLLQKIVLVTDRKDAYADELDVQEDEVANCVSGWSADELREWEAILVDWKNTAQIFGLVRGTPTVQATQLVELSSLVANPRPEPVPLGTPFVITGVQRCSGDLVGVTAEKVPGIDVKTGPGESTGEGSN